MHSLLQYINQAKKMKICFIFLLFLVLSILSIKGHLFSNALINHTDWNIPPYKEQISEYNYTSFFAWNNKMNLLGAPQLFPQIHNSLITNLFCGITGIDGIHAIKIIIILLLFLSLTSSYFLSRYFTNNNVISIAVAFFYAFSPISFNWLYFGWAAFYLGYALLPLMFLFFLKASSGHKTTGYSLVNGLLLSVVTAQTHNVILTGIVFLWYAILDVILRRNLTHSISGKIKRYVYIGTITLSVVVLTHLYWILPMVLSDSSHPTSVIVVNTIWLIWGQLQGGIINAMRGLGFFDPAYQLAFNKFLPYSAFFSLVTMGVLYSCLLLAKRNNEKFTMVFFLSLSIIGCLLSLGSFAPFGVGGIFKYLFVHFSVFRMFRSAFKFWHILFFCYIGLLCLSLNYLKEYYKRIFYFCSIIVALFPVTLFYFGSFDNTLTTMKIDLAYRRVNNMFIKEEEPFKVLYLPTDASPCYSNLGVADFINLTSSHSGSLGVHGSGTLQRSSELPFLLLSMYRMEDNIGSLLGRLGIKYIIYQRRVRAGTYEYFSEGKLDELKFINYLKRHKNLKLILEDIPLIVFENMDYIPVIRGVEGPDFVVGDRRYGTTKTKQSKDSIYLNQRENYNLLMSGHIDSIRYQDAEINDIVFTDPELQDYKLPIQSYCPGYWSANDWTPISSWFFFYKTIYNAQFEGPIIPASPNLFRALKEVNSTLRIPFTIKNETEYFLFCRMRLPDKGSILTMEILEGSNIIGKSEYSSLMGDQNFSWFRETVGDLTAGEYSLRITNHYGENVITNIYIVPVELYQRKMNITQLILY